MESIGRFCPRRILEKEKIDPRTNDCSHTCNFKLIFVTSRGNRASASVDFDEALEIWRNHKCAWRMARGTTIPLFSRCDVESPARSLIFASMSIATNEQVRRMFLRKLPNAPPFSRNFTIAEGSGNRDQGRTKRPPVADLFRQDFSIT